MDLLIVLVKTLLFYWVIVLVYRFMGKREIGELSIIDLIVSILIAELAAMSIENYKDNVLLSLIPIGVLVIVQILVSKFALKYGKLRTFLDGEPSVIVNRGKVNFKEMVKQRYNLEDLLTQLRAREVKSIEEVDYAILETSGKLSVFKKQKGKGGAYPMAIILDGQIQEDTLKQIHKSEDWLEEMLALENVMLDDVFYAFYRNHQLFIIKNSDCIS